LIKLLLKIFEGIEMKKEVIKRAASRLFFLFGLIALSYGLGRLYFHLTGGFSLSNISSDFSYHPNWKIRSLAKDEQEEVDRALNQSYYYLGKGCQSYVFLSEDHQYVIKFFKYQRFRLQPWLAYFPPLPAIVKYREEKIEKKRVKLEGFIQSWKIAFEDLKEETGLLFVHLNKTRDLNKELVIFDKIGQRHRLNLDDMEFCIQRKAEMLCSVLLKFKENNDLKEGQYLITRLLNLILSEYHRGLADNDHALMQNTGVVEGKPVHIDVGQFVKNKQIKDSSVYNQELFTKTYKFKIWLKEQYPELFVYLEDQLQEIMGPIYQEMKPKFREK
jgi:hypothetical protein